MLEQCGVWIGGELKSKYGQHGQYGINNEASMESVKHWSTSYWGTMIQCVGYLNGSTMPTLDQFNEIWFLFQIHLVRTNDTFQKRLFAVLNQSLPV